MNMNIKIYLAAILTLVFFISCQQTENPDTEKVNTISINPTSVEFKMRKGEEVQIDVEADGEWHLAELNDAISKWISVEPKSGYGDETVTVTCIEDTPYDYDRYAVLEFISGNTAPKLVVMQQGAPSRHITITWQADANAPTVFAPDGVDYQHYPYANNTSWKNVTEIYDGKGGELIVSGSTFREERTYIFNGYSLTCGGYDDKSYYYYPKDYQYIRLFKSYISTPVVENYRLSGVKATAYNSSSKACFTVSEDKAGEDPIDEVLKLNFGKPDPIDITIDGTEPDTEYYLVVTEDRYIMNITFVYEFVETL